MTIQAQYWVHEPDRPPVEHVADVATTEDVREFWETAKRPLSLGWQSGNEVHYRAC